MVALARGLISCIPSLSQFRMHSLRRGRTHFVARALCSLDIGGRRVDARVRTLAVCTSDDNSTEPNGERREVFPAGDLVPFHRPAEFEAPGHPLT